MLELGITARTEAAGSPARQLSHRCPLRERSDRSASCAAARLSSSAAPIASGIIAGLSRASVTGMDERISASRAARSGISRLVESQPRVGSRSVPPPRAPRDRQRPSPSNTPLPPYGQPEHDQRSNHAFRCAGPKVVEGHPYDVSPRRGPRPRGRSASRADSRWRGVARTPGRDVCR